MERRVYDLLDRPTRSPYGNPIPGLAEFDSRTDRPLASSEGERNLAFPGLTGSVVVKRICESVQTHPEVLRQLHAAGVDPGATVKVDQERDDGHRCTRPASRSGSPARSPRGSSWWLTDPGGPSAHGRPRRRILCGVEVRWPNRDRADPGAQAE